MALRSVSFLCCAGLATTIAFSSACDDESDRRDAAPGSSGNVAEAGQRAASEDSTGGIGGAAPDSSDSSGSGERASGGSTPAGASMGGSPAGEAGATLGGNSALSGAGGQPSEEAARYTFDSDRESWEVRYAEPANLADIANLVWSSNDGDPAPGMLELIAPFGGAAQNVGFGVVLPAPTDLRGKTIRARVQIHLGLDADLGAHPARAKIYVLSGSNNVHADTGRSIGQTGAWSSVALEVSAPAFVDTRSGSYDPGDIREIGVEIATDDATGTAMTGVVFVDTLTF